MAFYMESILVCLEDCDKRIARITDGLHQIERKEFIYLQMLRMAQSKEEQKICDSLKNDSLLKLNAVNGIKLIKVEKMIYTALTKVGNNALFPRLLVKYDELMRESYQLADDRVQEGLPEDSYLKYCADSLGQRNYIKAMCDYGMAR